MKLLNILFLYSFFLFQGVLESKILIITHAYNRPEFIPLQEITFKKFLQDEYEFVVFNDGRDPLHRAAIFDTCKLLGIRCIGIPQEIHDRPYLQRAPGDNFNASSVRAANVIQYSLDILGFKNNDIVVTIDSDLFLVKPFSIRNFMNGFQLAGILQPRNINYLWNGIVFMDMKNLPEKETLNFNCGKIKGALTDTGGYLYYYLSQHPNLAIKYLNQWHTNDFSESTDTLKSHGFTDKLLKFIELKIPSAVFIHDCTFLHYQNGSNWNNNSVEYHKDKFKKLEQFIEHIIS